MPVIATLTTTGGPLLKTVRLALASAFLATAALPVNHIHAQGVGPASVADIAAPLLDAVVNISTSQTAPGGSGRAPARPNRPTLPDGSPFQEFFDEFFNNDQGAEPAPVPGRKVNSLGSGFVIDAVEGIIITNNHVIENAETIEVNFTDGKTLPAKLIGTDPKTDIAVLQVDPKTHPLTAVKLGDSDAIRIGDWVMAIGNPFGLGGTLTVGVVSARNRNINAGPYDDFIQTDASINRGNSGGPLFNMAGEVVGINTAIFSTTGGSIGIGFSIPSRLATNVIDQLREFGETRRGWLGVRIQPVTDDIAESIELDSARGAMIAGIIKDGPVDDGSIKAGDVILTFDGREIKDVRDLPRIVAESPVGKEVDVVVWRQGKEETVKVTLGRLENNEEAANGPVKGDDAPEAPVETASVLGMTLGDLTDEVRGQFEIAEAVTGVAILEVAPGSIAADKGIVAGEVIVEIAQESVKSAGDVLDRVAKLKEGNRRNALLMIASATGEIRFETVRVE
jgi:serine protease Do